MEAVELSPAEILKRAQALEPYLSKEGYAELIAGIPCLSPPAPEVDENDIWNWHAKSASVRTALSELIASKDAEHQHSMGLLQGQFDCAIDQRDKAESERAALRAENERLRGAIELRRSALDLRKNAKGTCNEIVQAIHLEKLATELEAAERNTAEPATDTTPEVVVTDGDCQREQWARNIASYTEGQARNHVYRCAINLLTEAEARGRRQALEAATARLEWYRQYGAGMIDQRGFAASLIAELKRMMTGGK